MNKQLPATAHKSSILLIDDDLHQLESLANLFELDGLTPICCQTAECAMNVCKEQQVHVAILDLRMPDIDGIDLLKELKSIYPQMNIIIHTAHASVESAIAAVNEDAFAYIQKLGNVGELVSHVHRAFHLHFAAYSLLLEGVVKERDQDLSSTNKILKKEKTDRLTSEQEMREMHYALSNAMPGISKLSADGLYIKANTYCTDMLGYSKQELIGKSWETFIHPDDRLRTITAYHRMKEEGKAMFEARVLRKDSMVFHQQALMIKIADENNRFQGHHCFMRDITKRKETEDKLNYQASHDPLTGLINRVEFEKCVHNLLIESRENEVGHALCFLDLDQFKVINDTCGHAAGDRMLYEISRIMKDTARKNDTFARFGGDEFCIIMEHCPLDNAYQVALKILDAVKNYQFVWEGCVFRVGVSIGLVAVTDTTSSVSEFLKQADLACYVAKDKGRNRIHVYRNEDVELTQHRDEMASLTHIYQALKED
ncbi:MAG: diguanylate cyclase, partial [Desulfobulbaceae bacterium]|nr:diguanylate cyclase [Desulfobulbaceae bacterium]